MTDKYVYSRQFEEIIRSKLTDSNWTQQRKMTVIAKAIDEDCVETT